MAREKTATLEIKTRELKSVTEEQMESIKNTAVFRKYFEGSKYRILSTHFFHTDKKEKALGGCKSDFSDFYQVVVYDYARNQI